MPTIKANSVTLNYDKQGEGEPLVLIPYLAADHACYAFQVAEYAKHFTCYSVDLRGTGESDKPRGPYTTELFADDVAAFVNELGIERAHVAGLSLGAAVGMWLAAKYPENVQSLSVHGGWTKTDAFLEALIDSWRVSLKALESVPELTITSIFPWCFSPQLWSSKPDHIKTLRDFVRSRPAQPVASFLLHADAVAAHDVEERLGAIEAPTLVTFGELDMVTSSRFAEPITSRIRNSKLHVFQGCAHAPLYEDIEGFNKVTLEFLLQNKGSLGS